MMQHGMRIVSKPVRALDVSTPAALDAELKQGTEKWLQLIRQSGATAD